MRLLRAELTKLRRPLTLLVAVTAVVASLAFAWQGARNASDAARPARSAAGPLTCQDLALPPGALCARAIGVQEEIIAYRQRKAATAPSTRHHGRPSDALPVEQPLAAGKLALGFMSSLGGALLIFLLAAGHVAGEWDHRTLKTLLCQEGRRWRVLAAKFLSIVLAALALLIVDWLVLAAASPILRSAYPLPGPALSWAAAWRAVAADAARAPLVVALFSVVGVTAAVVVRSALGAVALATGVLLASLTAAGNLPAIAPWTLPYWVSGWMRFRSHGFVIYHFWVDAFPAPVHPPGVASGLIGVLAVGAVCAAAAVTAFRSLDVTT
jgi:ABC-type transport system involved in multi-copper enzyme maturation permease subunit